MGILCVFCVYDTIGNRCFEKTSFPKTVVGQCVLTGERTKAHWDKSPLGQKPTGQYPTGQKPTAKFGRVDKSPLLKKIC